MIALIRRAVGIVLSFFLCSNLQLVNAQEFSGHQKIQLSDAERYGEGEGLALALDSRFNFEYQWAETRIVTQTELLTQAFTQRISAAGTAANGIVNLLADSESGSALNDDLRVLDLSVELAESQHLAATLRMDRLYVSQEIGDSVFKVGRQSLSWGNGLVFSVLDLLNPLPPLSIDKDYKTGQDMVLLEVPWGSSQSLQIVAVGRKDAETRQVSAAESSFGSKLKVPALQGDLELVAGRHFEDSFLGVGFSRSVAGAVVRADLMSLESQQENWKETFLLNIDRTFIVFERNVYFFLEYFHSPFGVDNLSTLFAQENQFLLERLGRGELFTLGRNYLSPGFRVELNPLTNIQLLAIHNLGDHSSVMQPRFEYDILEDLELILGLVIPLGSSGTEYGEFAVLEPTGQGQNISSTQERRNDPATGAFLRVSYFF